MKRKPQPYAHSVEEPREMSTPRAYTAKEVRERLLNYFMALSELWATTSGKTDREKCDGLLFSILVTLDGGSVELPAFDISPSPHPSDKAHYLSRGENWYKKGMVINNCQLHELFSEMRRTKSSGKIHCPHSARCNICENPAKKE